MFALTGSATTDDILVIIYPETCAGVRRSGHHSCSVKAAAKLSGNRLSHKVLDMESPTADLE